jgi:ubiquinone/menaquinone biosynthesis C-methylase UbiE
MPERFYEVGIETVRDYWNVRPCNIRHSPLPVGSEAYFDQVEARKYFVEPHIPGFAQFERWQGKQVLEIGCGIGTDTINFARHGASVTALELSDVSLDVARKRAEVFELSERINFILGDAESLGDLVPSTKIDLIYSFGVIHHSPNPERILEQISRLAQPGTTIKIMVYHRHSWKAFWILLKYGKGRFWRASELIAQYSEAQSGCPITYAYTPREISLMVSQQGLQPTEVSIQHIFPYRIEDYVNYRYVKEWYFRWMPSVLFRWLEQRIGWHLCLTAKA